MTQPTNDEIEARVIVPPEMAVAVKQYADDQDALRGNWANPRDAVQPDPPFPAMGNPMLKYLHWKAMACIADGMDPQAALISLAVNAWFEGGVEGYDRGRFDCP